MIFWCSILSILCMKMYNKNMKEFGNNKNASLNRKKNAIKVIWATCEQNMWTAKHLCSLISAFVVCYLDSIIPALQIQNFKTLASLCSWAARVSSGWKSWRQIFSWWGSYHHQSIKSQSVCHIISRIGEAWKKNRYPSEGQYSPI